MSAKEQFKKEGYKLGEDNYNLLEYYRNRGIYKNCITFIKERKHVSIFSFEKDSKKIKLSEVNTKTLQAIQKQIEELGWLV